VKKSEHLKNLSVDARRCLDVLFFQRDVVNKQIDGFEDLLLELSVNITTAELEEAGLIVDDSFQSKDRSSVSSQHKRTQFKFYEV
jgi:myo-inositol catabolism protein IolC